MAHANPPERGPSARPGTDPPVPGPTIECSAVSGAATTEAGEEHSPDDQRHADGEEPEIPRERVVSDRLLA